MDAESRLTIRLLRESNQLFVRDGEVHIGRARILEIASEEGTDEQETDHVLATLIEQGLLDSMNWHHFTATPEAALHYETAVDRKAHWEANVLRRRLLIAGADAYRSDDEPLITRDERGAFHDVDWNRLWGAMRALESMGLFNERRGMGSMRLSLTAEGFNIAREEKALAALLPTGATEDELAHAAVAPDVLQELVRDTEQMLRARGWDSALAELERGDDELEKGDWVDAVSEYYAALESGLRYRLDELGETASDGASLRDLSRLAASKGAIPPNYQAMFEFTDSIRSPRRHGRGARPTEVEVGPAEALLMGNHVRALLVYLGQRPA